MRGLSRDELLNILMAIGIVIGEVESTREMTNQMAWAILNRHKPDIGLLTAREFLDWIADFAQQLPESFDDLIIN